ncbi:MAG TPA: hypothetical protein VJ672_05970 [Gemmatimonadaceae bacterium]|nr:hypothetical protein [Gemmatimonadaceae bacterium]
MLPRLRIGLHAGLLSAAATGGALVGFGIARGAPLQPINAVAHLLLGSRALLFDGFDPLVTTTGIVLHVVSVVIWAVLFALPAARLRALLVWLGALLFTAVVYLADVRLLPESLRPGFERVLTTTELVSVYVLLALSLALGVLLVRSREENQGEGRDDLRRARDTRWLQNATMAGEREKDPIG